MADQARRRAPSIAPEHPMSEENASPSWGTRAAVAAAVVVVAVLVIGAGIALGRRNANGSDAANLASANGTTPDGKKAPGTTHPGIGGDIPGGPTGSGDTADPSNTILLVTPTTVTALPSDAGNGGAPPSTSGHAPAGATPNTPPAAQAPTTPPPTATPTTSHPTTTTATTTTTDPTTLRIDPPTVSPSHPSCSGDASITISWNAPNATSVTIGISAPFDATTSKGDTNPGLYARYPGPTSTFTHAFGCDGSAKSVNYLLTATNGTKTVQRLVTVTGT
jgi:hypothetical protein